MNYSKQRELILQTLLGNPVHPTADEVFLQVRRQSPRISLGTVYRNLNQLADNGMIRKISMANQPDRFDGTLEHHYHICCTECGSVMDVVCPGLERLEDFIEETTSFEVTGHQLIVHGVCARCASKINPIKN